MISLTIIATGLVCLLAYREHLMVRERRDWQAERQLLITRIQAPELGVAHHMQQTAVPDQPAVSPFDDTDYWEQANQVMTQFEKDLSN